MRPTVFEFCAVKKSMPSGAKSGVCGSRTPSGILYSTTSPVFGSSLPT
jgi:hypothetical protein